MTRILLVRGMLAGVVAGLFVFALARWIGEPQVERAIAFETSMDQAKGEAPEPEIVGRQDPKRPWTTDGDRTWTAQPLVDFSRLSLPSPMAGCP